MAPGARSFQFEFSTALPRSASELWAHATDMAGVNRELWPLVQMTHPRHLTSLAGHQVPIGERLFRSWILLFGVVPIDYDDLTLLELEPGKRFLERSPMLSQRQWQHERIITAKSEGCTVTDRVCFVPRIGALGPVLLLVFRFAFWLRHRNLRRMFGA